MSAKRRPGRIRAHHPTQHNNAHSFLVDRPALLVALDRAAEVPVTAISAPPAGAAMTTQTTVTSLPDERRRRPPSRPDGSSCGTV